MGTKGWMVLVWVVVALAILGVIGAVWDAFSNEKWYRLAFIPLNLAFWAWVGGGAWRRAQGDAAVDAGPDAA